MNLNLNVNLKPVLRYGVFTAAIYLIFVVAMLPAQNAWGFLQPRLPGDVKLYGVDGTLWSGAAASAVINRQEYRQLRWDFEPLALLAGRIQYALAFNNGASKANAVIGRSLTGNLLFQDVTARLTAVELNTYLKLPAVRLNGAFDIDLQRLRIVDGRIVAADGTLAWKQAGLQSPRSVVLGDLGVTLETVDDGIKGTVLDHGGALQANGILMLSPDGEYKFTGMFASRDSADTGLVQALRMMGKTGPDGKVNVSFSGKIPPLFIPAAAAG